VMFSFDLSSPAFQPPVVKSPRRVLGIVIALAVVPLVLVVVAVAIVVGLSAKGSGRNHTTTTTRQPPPNLLTLGGLPGFLSQIRTKFGDTMGYELDINGAVATLYRPDPANAHKSVEWTYSETGWGDPRSSHIPPNMTSAAVGADTVLGDLSKFDVQAVVGVLRTAPQRVNINNPIPADTWLYIYSAQNGRLDLRIAVDNESHDQGDIELAADGTVTETRPVDS
jgi:hypothetical protein